MMKFHTNELGYEIVVEKEHIWVQPKFIPNLDRLSSFFFA
jgi:hypothetical protein